MKTVYQDLTESSIVIKRLIKKNPNVSPSRIFRILRKQNRFSYFGDLVIFQSVLFVFIDSGINKNRSTIAYSVSLIPEYKKLSKNEKTELLNYILKFNCSIEKGVSLSTINELGKGGQCG